MFFNNNDDSCSSLKTNHIVFQKCTQLSLVLDYLENNIIYAGYILPNINHYGFNSSFFELYYAKNVDNKVVLVATRYYNSSHVICLSPNTLLLNEYACFVKKNKIKRISGNYVFMDCLKHFFNKPDFLRGSIILLNSKHDITSLIRYKYKQARSVDEFSAVAYLLLEDGSFAKNYSFETLCSQLFERYIGGNGRTYYIMSKNDVAACASTYSEDSRLAVISGVKTSRNYFRNGYGSSIVASIANVLFKENKKVILYCYDMNLIGFYKKIGVSQIVDCAKIELFNT